MSSPAFRRAALWLGAFLLLFGVTASGTGWANASPFFTLPSFEVPTIAIFLSGGLMGLLLRCGLGHDAQGDFQFRDLMVRAPFPAVLAIAALFLLGARFGIPPERAVMGLFLALAAFAAALRCIDLLTRGEEIGFESHWGGLGGGSSGWRVFPATGLAILALSLAGASLALVTLKEGAADTASPPAAATKKGTASAPAVEPGPASVPASSGTGGAAGTAPAPTVAAGPAR